MIIIPDQSQREQALDPEQSFIVQAPAGSGKTELLIQRLLVLLARVKEPEEILAITFTRKAAAEMANRVIEALQRAQNEPEPSKDPARKTWHLAHAVLKRDQLQNWQLLVNPHRLRIQTIDAFCAALTRQMPILSQFGTQPMIAEDAYSIYREAVRNFMATLDADEEWSDALAELLLHLDNQHSKVEELLMAMLARRDQWLPHITGIHNTTHLRQLLENELRYVVEEKLQQLSQHLPSEEHHELLELILYACQQLENQQANSALLCCKSLQTLPEQTANSLKEWQAIASFLLTQKLEWRKSATVKDGFPTIDKSCTQFENESRKQMKARFLTLLNNFATNDELLQTLQDILQLPPCHFTEMQWQTLTALLTILRILAGFLWLGFQEQNSVDYIEIAQRALQALGEAGDPSQLALLLDYRIQHILVDEFQDTSTVQFRLLEKLTAGWQNSDGRTLFIVGDPMQSIYRFRKAEVGLFIQAELFGINEIHLTKLALTANFRSQTSLVNWFNAAFSKIFPSTANMSIGAIPYTTALGLLPSTTEQPVKIHAYLQNSNEETQTIIKLIQNYLASKPQTKIAILVRARSHLTELIPALQTAAINYRAVEIETLNHKAVIHDLLALTRALLFLEDRIAWLAILRAPWCGLTHADLYAIAGIESQLSLWERLQAMDSLELSPEGQERITRLVTILKPYLEHRYRKPLAHWLESVWLQLGGPANIKNLSELDDAQTYFKLIAQIQRGEDITNIKWLEQKLTELYAAPANSSDISVELMTIHKAKGLEFDVVILPCMHKEGSSDKSQLLLFAERPEATKGIGLILAPIKSFAEQQDPIYQFVQREEKQKANYELCRLLYVAVTRAKCHLHILGQVKFDSEQKSIKPPAKDSLLGKLWPHIANEINQQITVQTHDFTESTPLLPSKTHLTRFIDGWQTPLNNFNLTDSPLTHAVSLTTYQNRHDTLRHTGTLLHRIFYQLSQTPLIDWPKIMRQENHWRISLLNLGVTPHEISFAIKLMTNALEKTQADQRGCWILANTHQQAQSEFALSYFDGNTTQHVIIDRTFIDESGTRWIIDYKNTLTEESKLLEEQVKYRTQLETYAKIMQQLENRPIRLGLYFPLLPSWHEWNYE
ncbi:MAG: UvrD/REP helicase [Gammaproteobacteria bacterium]|jgi:ATP-dependent exoDNAse (exonuclease V) beta subunit|nr:UvrD/REP helicase [Gammaproteobacteria bacterium]